MFAKRFSAVLFVALMLLCIGCESDKGHVVSTGADNDQVSEMKGCNYDPQMAGEIHNDAMRFADAYAAQYVKENYPVKESGDSTRIFSEKLIKYTVDDMVIYVAGKHEMYELLNATPVFVDRDRNSIDSWNEYLNNVQKENLISEEGIRKINEIGNIIYDNEINVEQQEVDLCKIHEEIISSSVMSLDTLLVSVSSVALYSTKYHLYEGFPALTQALKSVSDHEKCKLNSRQKEVICADALGAFSGAISGGTKGFWGGSVSTGVGAALGAVYFGMSASTGWGITQLILYFWD